MRTDTVLIFVFFLEVQAGSQSLISYRSVSQNWCFTGSCLWWRCLQSKWKTIKSIFFHTLLVRSQELSFSYKAVASVDFYSKFSIFIYYSRPSRPIYFEMLSSYHRIWSPIRLESKTVPFHFGISLQQQHKHKHMWLKCLPDLHQS